ILGGVALLLVLALFFGLGPGRRLIARNGTPPAVAPEATAAPAAPALSPSPTVAATSSAPPAAATPPATAAGGGADACAAGLAEAETLSTTDIDATIARLESLPRTGGSCDQVNPRLVELYLGRGRAQIGMDHADQAVSDFHKAVDLGGGGDAQD